MAYKQSPFPMIEGTSPVKALPLLKYGIKYGLKAAKWAKKTFSKSKAKQILPKSKSANFKGTIRKGNNPAGKGAMTYPGQMSVTHPQFISTTAKKLKRSQAYWFNPLK